MRETEKRTRMRQINLSEGRKIAVKHVNHIKSDQRNGPAKDGRHPRTPPVNINNRKRQVFNVRVIGLGVVKGDQDAQSRHRHEKEQSKGQIEGLNRGKSVETG